MDRPTDREGDLLNSDRDQPERVEEDESRWLDEGGSNTQFRPADRVPVGEGIEPPEADTVVDPPASDMVVDNPSPS